MSGLPRKKCTPKRASAIEKNTNTSRHELNDPCSGLVTGSASIPMNVWRAVSSLREERDELLLSLFPSYMERVTEHSPAHDMNSQEQSICDSQKMSLTL